MRTNTFFELLFFVGLLSASWAQSGAEEIDAAKITQIARERLEVTCKHPFRQIGDKVCDLRSLITWERRNRPGTQPMSGWDRLVLKVKQSGVDGGLVAEEGKDKVTVFIRNCPLELTEGKTAVIFAIPDGTYETTDTNKTKLIIPAFDYGTPLTAEEAEPHLRPLAAKPRPPVLKNLDQQIAIAQQKHLRAQSVLTETQKLIDTAPTLEQKNALRPIYIQRSKEVELARKQLQALQHQKQGVEMKRRGTL